MASTRHPSLCRSIGREEYKECFRDDLNKKSPIGWDSFYWMSSLPELLIFVKSNFCHCIISGS